MENMELVREDNAVVINGSRFAVYILRHKDGRRFISSDEEVLSEMQMRVARSAEYIQVERLERSASLEVHPPKDQGRGQWIQMLVGFELNTLDKVIPIKINVAE